MKLDPIRVCVLSEDTVEVAEAGLQVRSCYSHVQSQSVIRGDYGMTMTDEEDDAVKLEASRRDP